jgi:hypothetical protein
VLDVGPLPEPSLGLGVRWGGWRRARSGRILVDQTWALPAYSDLGADASRWQGYVLKNRAIFAAAAVCFETSRPALVVEGLGEIGQVGPVQPPLSLGPEWIF